MYNEVLGELLDSIYLPISVKNCKESFCKKHDDEIIKLMNDITEVVRLATDITIPKKQKYASHNSPIPGWTKYVNFYKQKSMLWGSIWKEMQCPTSGYVYEIHKQTKKVTIRL